MAYIISEIISPVILVSGGRSANSACMIKEIDANKCLKGLLTCRLMKLDVVSEDVLPSERLKRLLRLGNFLGSCNKTGTDK